MLAFIFGHTVQFSSYIRVFILNLIFHLLILCLQPRGGGGEQLLRVLFIGIASYLFFFSSILHRGFDIQITIQP